MLDLNSSTLSAVVDQAMTAAAAHPRWLTAINRAVVEVLSNPYLHRQDDGSLLIASPSGRMYSSNGVCQCEAFMFGQPCWHRAAARIVRLHDERQAKKEIDADLTALLTAQRETMDAIHAAQAVAQNAMDELYA